jgi:signal transduction histidine kinase
MASHELRSPLTAVLGFADVLQRRWDALDDARKLESIATIQRQGRRLQLLVEDLLTLSSIEANGLALDVQPIRLRELLVDATSAVMDHPPELNGELDTVVDADPLRLGQIVTNLVTNAQKYGEPPYAVTVRTTPDAVRIEVRDHGPGVPPEFVGQLFERFTQADRGPGRRSHGVGLGLAICRALADAHGAELCYQDAPGGGACFVVSLPR